MKTYEKYKKINQIWLDLLPEHWENIKLRQILRPFSEKNHPELQLLSVVREKGVIVRNTEHKEENHNFIPEDLSGYKRVKQGQFVINKMKAWQGSYGVSKYDGIVSPAYFVFDFNQDFNPDFFNYAIRSKIYVSFFGSASDGIRVGQWDLSMQKMKEIPFLLPPRGEQDQIVRFLDWKVSCINKLISLYNKKIFMLNEMKYKIIDRAVINGRKTNNFRSHNDKRWDIDYPSHWNLKRFREMFTFRKGLSITKENLKETGISVINYGQIHSKINNGVELNKDLIRFVDYSYMYSAPNAIVNKGDFIFADTSEDLEGCGNCVYIDLENTIFAGYHSIIAHNNKSNDNKYFAYLFKSQTWRSQIRKKVNAVKVYSITQKILKDVYLLIPPLEEQKEIVSYLDKNCKKIDLETQKIESIIKTLKALKTRLISDVVTGKIDVRDIEIPDYEFVAEEQTESSTDTEQIEERED